MLYDVRTYTCRPGTIKKQLELYQELGFEAQRKHLGDPVLYLQTETGNVNSFTHIWGYQDAADRMARRAALQKDPDWQVYLKKSVEMGNLVSQENHLMVPTPFFKP
ncbi:MAG: NIPSNAP family containing protein [Bordetella sp. SCN 67-23]|nr:NIPSNAP family protein [Burkholderiales bacterium]ODS76176.1 MAG: NIPSNAP family containing protein [Bordetella sp. SCN 67-23]OJW93673.1 MAG: NIPSNAP family protein [Burkholderiales bacterium 67-32]